ncbi:MAG: MupG family TIM beta-alpha barrel fold protein [Firmicutes bacterium]|nr:MupG family TIM beta-alpha barrel fold protein [Bacillota bacterium]MCL5040003.1 MupG family TIM beta-alpha barrel fold protein [Bacillota bacterium]
MTARKTGISLYPGLYNSREEIMAALERAASFGVTEVFTSLHIPEANPGIMLADCQAMGRRAQELGLRITADVAPVSFDRLGASVDRLEPFVGLGLGGLRADYGFSLQDLVRLANNPLGLKLVLNASSIREELVKDLLQAGVKPERLEACHNFYPRRESGLAWRYFLSQSTMLKEAGIEVAAFVASRRNRRAVMYEGLPTVETHRGLTPARAAEELWATGVVDIVYVGDPLTPEDELAGLARVAGRDHLELRLRVAGELSQMEREILFTNVHTQPWSEFAYVIRARGARQTTSGPQVLPRNTVPRPRGTVTIDNVSYARFAGELQITLVDLPPDPRVNVVGHILPEDLPLLERIGPGGRFGFREIAE